MTTAEPAGVAKVHPASREVLPDDPMEMQAFEIPGDRDLMLRLLVEEYARIGWGVDSILEMARDPNYTAFHGLQRSLGEEELRRRVGEIVARCGVIRIRTTESVPISEQLVQIELPTTGEVGPQRDSSFTELAPKQAHGRNGHVDRL